MTVTCPSCSRKYRLDPARLAGKSSVTVRCPGCGATSTLEAPPEGDKTTRLAADAGLIAEPARLAAGEPALPEGQRVTLAVLEGPDSGKMFRIDRPSVVIGRGEGDIRLEDAEVSRRHARLTVHGQRIVLKDLDSTNGTFLDERKISEAFLENRTEFRVGTSRVMVIVSDEGGTATGENP